MGTTVSVGGTHFINVSSSKWSNSRENKIIFLPVVLLLLFSRDNPAKIKNVYRIMLRVVASHPQE